MISNRIKLISIALISLSITTTSFAASACVIDSSPSPLMADYLTRLDAAINKLEYTTSSQICKTVPDNKRRGSDNIEQGASAIVKNTNRALTQDDYMSASRFSIDLVIRSEIPNALRRDYNLLLSKQNRLNSLIDTIYGKCAGDLEVDTNLINDETYTTGKPPKSILWDLAGDLLNNHIRIIGFYRESVIGTPPTKSGFFLVDPDFEWEIPDLYGPKGTEICNKKWDPFKRVTDAVDRIGNLGGGIERGTEDWKIAWALLQSPWANYTKVERNILAKELTRQWLSSKSSAVILRNLAYYNKTEQHRGLTGFVEDVGDRVSQGFWVIKKNYNDLIDNLNKSNNTDQYLDRFRNIESLKTNLAKEIYTDYQSLMDSISDENLNTDEINGRLTDIYNEVNNMTTVLNPARRVAKDTCNQQTKNAGGNCTGK